MDMMTALFKVPARGVLLTLSVGLGLSAVAEAEPSIEVQGLFRDRALLTINGTSRVVKAGDPSRDGVRLISATPQQAVIEIDGEKRILTLSDKISGGYAQPGQKEVAITRNNRQEYRVGGMVNGRRVEFLVDTGANVVAFSASEAKRLGIDYQRGIRSLAETASGVVKAWSIMLDRVTVGDISAANITASVLEGEYPGTALLGMSWLRHVDLSERNGVLYLQSRY